VRKIQRILVALDLEQRTDELTPGSRRATDLALALAPKIEAEAILLHSTAEDEHWDAPSDDYVVVPGGLSSEGRRSLEAVLAEFREAGIAASLETPSEKPMLAIIKRVLGDSIGLVVCGKRNYPNTDGQPIGSVTTNLVRKCPCAVWAVKAGSDAVPSRILAASDGAEVGSRVVRYAGFIAEHLEAELHVAHAIQLPMTVQVKGVETEHEFEHRRSAELAQMFEEQLAEAGYTGNPFFEMGITAPTSAIIKVVQRFNPDLVVMGTIGRAGIAGVLVGNTAERLLQRLDCSLLTLKPVDFVCPVELDETR
jgi:universal stress protein E